MNKRFLFSFLFAAIAITSFTNALAAAPTSTAINAFPATIKGGATITITVQDANDFDSNALNFYCSETAIPDSNNTICNELGASYSYPYSDARCTYDTNSDDTTHNVSCVLFDGAEYSGQNTASFTTDSTAPATIFSGCGAGWNTTNQNIQLSSADADLNVTLYRIDDGAITSTLLTTDGNHKIEYYSTDDVGNTEATKTEYCAIDKSAPKLNNFSPATATNSNMSTIVFDLNDDGSGLNLAATTITIDGNVIASAGHVSYALPYAVQDKNIVIDINAVDNIGNSTIYGIGFLVDTIAPATSSSGCSVNGWSNSNQAITFSCTDSNGSGCNATQFRLSNANWQNGTSVTLSDDGNHKIDYYGTDNAGNNEAAKTFYCAIDKTAPSVTMNSPSTSGRNATISWSGSDSNSGIQIYYLYKGGNQVYSGTATSYTDTALPDGSYTYKVKAKDNVNNESGFSNEVTATISTSSVPDSSSSSSSSSFGGSSNRSVLINLSISSAGSAGIGKYPITINGDEPFEGGYQLKIKLAGSTEFKNIGSATIFSGKSVTVEYEFKAGDDGNATIVAVAWSSSGSRAEKEKTIIVDTKLPNIELLAPKARDTATGTITLKANATDGNESAKSVSFYYRIGKTGDWQPIAASAVKKGNSWDGNWNTALLENGSYQFRAVASDEAGNKAEKIIELSLSNAKPDTNASNGDNNSLTTGRAATGNAANAATAGMAGFVTENFLAIIAGLVVAVIIAGAFFIPKTGFSFIGGESGYARASDWSYNESPHEKVLAKIGSTLNDFIGFGKSTQGGRKWVFRKDSTGTGARQSGLNQLFEGINSQKKLAPASGKGKWASKLRNDDI